MRGIQTPVSEIRHKIFTEIARVAYESDNINDSIEAIPFKVCPGDIASYRESIFHERAIASERVRLAMGMSLRPADHVVHVTSGLEESNIAEKYYEPPLMQVIPSACNFCEDKKYEVSNMCQGCIAHPCMEVCPKDAISRVKGKAVIDQEKCIKCGKCKSVCPYDAIAKKERPCSMACGVGAIGTDQYGRAKIDAEKCVSCGQCMVSCPFGAIADKSQIFQLIRCMKQGGNVIAEVAPAFVGQFGPDATPSKVKAALLELGFSDVVETALGADIGAVAEAHHYANHVATGELPFLLTSCCPSWAMLAKTQFPDLIESVSSELTPMVATARSIKKEHPDAKVVFIGPCAAKKLEASRRSVRSDIDFVLTFEEMAGVFDAKGIDFDKLEVEESLQTSSSLGKGFAASGGVAAAVVNAIHCIDPEMEVKTVKAEGLSECKKMLAMAKSGRYDGYLLEGMACPGGCMGGAGVLADVRKATMALEQEKKQSDFEKPSHSDYLKYLDLITKENLYENEN